MMRKVTVTLTSMHGEPEMATVDFVDSLGELKLLVSDLWVRFSNIQNRLRASCEGEPRQGDEGNGNESFS